MYKNHLKFLNDVYIDLNSNYSKAYLQGSIWYIGETLIDNALFVYPPNDILVLYGSRKHNIETTKLILDILSRYIKKKTVDTSEFILNYNIDMNFKENLYITNTTK